MSSNYLYSFSPLFIWARDGKYMLPSPSSYSCERCCWSVLASFSLNAAAELKLFFQLQCSTARRQAAGVGTEQPPVLHSRPVACWASWRCAPPWSPPLRAPACPQHEAALSRCRAVPVLLSFPFFFSALPPQVHSFLQRERSASILFPQSRGCLPRDGAQRRPQPGLQGAPSSSSPPSCPRTAFLGPHQPGSGGGLRQEGARPWTRQSSAADVGSELLSASSSPSSLSCLGATGERPPRRGELILEFLSLVPKKGFNGTFC